MKLDPSLKPEWDEFNIMHIDRHGFVPEQIEEVYYGEGPYPSLVVQVNRRQPSHRPELRLLIWGTDSSGNFLEVVVAPRPERNVWRCVTAVPMRPDKRRSYLKRVGKPR
jgi:hypothetical protein